MKSVKGKCWLIAFGMCFLFPGSYSQEIKIKAACPDASPEAKALLKFFYTISGHYILTGQHSYPNTHGRNYYFAAKYIGMTPIIFSTDMGFAKPGDTDSYLARPDIVKRAIELHKQGAIITLCWHAVPPTADEPVTFRPQPGDNPDSLASVQGHLTDRQFKDVLTPGTALYKKWCAQVDSVTVYLKKLQDAHVPILWRPCHEMNGDWFWWGGRQGEYSTVKLYKQLFDRLVTYHKLNNLIWIWSVDRPNKPEMKFSNFYPGNKYFDIVSLDVYGNDFQNIYYDSLVVLSKGKPMVLGEVGTPPSPEVLESQSRWAYYSIWAGMVRNTTMEKYDQLINDPRVLFLGDSAYRELITPYRQACGLPVSPVNFTKPADFSGVWVFNEEKSALDNFGAVYLPSKLEIEQNGNELNIKRTVILEYTDNSTTEDNWTADGREYRSEFRGAPMLTRVRLSPDNDTLFVRSKVTFGMGDQAREFVTDETWTIRNRGKELCIEQNSDSFREKRSIRIVFNRQYAY
jgi:mannan endo-1,4-beta-mannosidase